MWLLTLNPFELAEAGSEVLAALVSTPSTAHLPWYLGLSKDRLEESGRYLCDEKQVELVLHGLTEKKLVERKGETYTLNDRDIHLKLY